MKKVKKFIERKSMIYKTAVEYGDYTLNHVQGCAHGCKFPCYAFMMAKRFGKVKNYEEWIEPALVSNAIELVKKEIPKYKNRIQQLHLCFTTDPFMYQYDEIVNTSLEIIELCNQNNINCSVLTKGILPNELSKYSKRNEYGITIVSLNEKYRQEYEPYSANYQDRISALYYLHKKGYKTWVSIEPYPTPNIIEQNLSEILERISFVDKIIFGKTNYNKKISEYKNYKNFYNDCSNEVIRFCYKNDIAYHIKNGTIDIINK